MLETIRKIDALQLVDKLEDVALRLGHGQSARRECNTGTCTETQTGVFPVVHLVLLQMGLDLWLVCLVNIGHNNVLVRGETERALVEFGQFTKTRPERQSWLVDNTPIL